MGTDSDSEARREEPGDEHPVLRLSRDLRKAAATLKEREVRYLVDAYYAMQRQRIRADNQIRALGAGAEPHAVIDWLSSNSETLEGQVRAALDHFSKAHALGPWLRQHVGVGPVISAGLLAHLSFTLPSGERVRTVSPWWRFAGLDPTVKWGKGQKRPWNAALKTLCWKLSDSFKKFSFRDDCWYGQRYRERKRYEVERDQRGGNAECARLTLEERTFQDEATKACYESGKLPPGRLDLRAMRWTVKLFLSHYHDYGYEVIFGEKPPAPYPIAFQGHSGLIYPPPELAPVRPT